MIIQYLGDYLLSLCQNLITFTIAPIESIASVFQYIDLMITFGINIFKYFIPPTSRVILTIIVGCHIALTTYYIILWVLKKVPLLDIH